MKVLLIDNNDSFTYNIVDLFRKINYVELSIITSDKLNQEEIANFNKYIISPGPGTPQEFPIFKSIISHCTTNKKSLLGICLGHQAICQYFGGKLVQLENVVHGQQKTAILDNNSPIYKDMRKQIDVGLYHSWVIETETLPSCLKTTGFLKNNLLMSVKHTNFNIYGIQFHPESFLTQYGQQIIENFLAI